MYYTPPNIYKHIDNLAHHFDRQRFQIFNKEMLDLQIKDMNRYITAPINYSFHFHILCCKMKCIYISLGRNPFPRFNMLSKSDREKLPTSQDTGRVGQQC